MSALLILPVDASLSVAPRTLSAFVQNGFAASLALARGGPSHMYLAQRLAEVKEVKRRLGARLVEWLIDYKETSESAASFIVSKCSHIRSGIRKNGACSALWPITETNFGDGIFDWVKWFDYGDAIALSLNSNIQIPAPWRHLHSGVFAALSQLVACYVDETTSTINRSPHL